MNFKINAKDLSRWIVNRKWFVLICAVGFFLLAASGMRFIVVNNDYHVYFSKENPQLVAFDGLKQKYTNDDNVFIMLEPANGKVFTKENLNAIKELADSCWGILHTTRVDAITNFQHINAIDNDLYVQDLIGNVDTLSNVHVEHLERIAQHEPMLINRLIDSSATVTAINVTVILPQKSLTENVEVAAHARKLVNNWQQRHPNFKTYFTGNVIFNATFDENFESDMMRLTPLMFLVIITFLILTTKSISATIISFLLVLMSMFTGLGLGGWLNIGLSGPVFSAPNMIMTLAVSNAVHLFVLLLQTMRQGKTKELAIVESFHINFIPLIVTNVTTAISFLTLNFSDTPPFRALGTITALGIVASLFYTIFLAPALAAILPIKTKTNSATTEAREFWLSRSVANFVIANKYPVLLITVLFTVIMAFFSLKNELNNQFIKFFDNTVAFRTDSDYIDDKLTGMYTIEFSLSSGASDGITHPEYLEQVQQFEQWFKQQHNVVSVTNLTQPLKQINKAMHGNDDAYYILPKTKEEGAQYLLLYEMSLPYGFDLNNQINVDKSETRFTVNVNNITSKGLIALTENAEHWLTQNAPGMFSNGISMSLMFSHITKRNMNSMIKGGLIGLIMISVVLVIVLGSFKYGWISILPNLAPMAIAFGVWAIFVGSINMAVAVVIAMVLGIICDDTTHFVVKYQHALRNLKKSPEDAVRYAFSTVSKAALITSLTLTAGFLIMAQSHFGFNADMAKVTAIAIMFALIFDLTMLPALLLSVDKLSKKKTSSIEVEEKETISI